MNFIFEQIRTGGDRNFGYLIGDRKAGACAFVDPSYQPQLFLDRAGAQKLKCQYIFNTHGHGDHTNGNETLKKVTKAKVAIHSSSSVEYDLGLEDDQILKVGSIEIRIIHTPGHIQDHVVYFLPNYNIALTGDHLFIGKIGGTGSQEDALLQYKSLNKLLDNLPKETTIWPGHDYGSRPCSTLAMEKDTNPFLLAKNFEEFSHLKDTWRSFKQEYGLI